MSAIKSWKEVASIPSSIEVLIVVVSPSIVENLTFPSETVVGKMSENDLISLPSNVKWFVDPLNKLEDHLLIPLHSALVIPYSIYALEICDQKNFFKKIKQNKIKFLD